MLIFASVIIFLPLPSPLSWSHWLERGYFISHHVPKNLWSSNIWWRGACIPFLNYSKYFLICYLWPHPQYVLRWRSSYMWTPRRLYFLGFLERPKIGLCSTLLRCVVSEMNSRYSMFNSIFPKIPSFHPFTLGHTKIGYVCIISVNECHRLSFVKDSSLATTYVTISKL